MFNTNGEVYLNSYYLILFVNHRKIERKKSLSLLCPLLHLALHTALPIKHVGLKIEAINTFEHSQACVNPVEM